MVLPVLATPVPPLAAGKIPVTLLVKSMEPASMSLVILAIPMDVELPILVTSPVKLAFVAFAVLIASVTNDVLAI